MNRVLMSVASFGLYTAPGLWALYGVLEQQPMIVGVAVWAGWILCAAMALAFVGAASMNEEEMEKIVQRSVVWPAVSASGALIGCAAMAASGHYVLATLQIVVFGLFWTQKQSIRRKMQRT